MTPAARLLPEAPDLRRVVVIGSSASGKTTLASTLAEATGGEHIELDGLHWEPGWQEAGRDVFRARVREAIAAPRWACDGNYGVVRDLVWGRATAVVWLDLPFPTVFARAVRRTARRLVTREQLFGGENRERVLGFLEPDWIPWWVIRTWRVKRRTIPGLLADPDSAHLTQVHLRTPAEVAAFVAAQASPGDDAR